MENILENDAKLKEYSEKLDALRKDGVNKITELRQDIAAAKRNKLLDKTQREERIASDMKVLEDARIVAEKNKEEIAALTKESVAYTNSIAVKYIEDVKAEQKEVIVKAKDEYSENIQKIKSSFATKKAEIVKSYEGKIDDVSKANKKRDINNCAYELKSALFDEKSHRNNKIQFAKMAINQAYVDRVQKNRAFRNGTPYIAEDIGLSWQNYKNSFKASKFFLDNGLYITIIIFFIVCIIIAPLTGNGALFSLPNIFTILEQSSTRMFYALGVAGLILIAGTDLSVGRMVALGSVVTGLILHSGKNIVTMFKMGPWDFTAMSIGGRLAFALFLSILLCVIFSAFAGVFTAKLKIHPFISTLATQLIIYGLLFFGTSGTPVGSIDGKIKDMIGGRWVMGVINGELVTFPKLIIPAIIAIFVAWFIWNKTTFGKNMYAVGGNSEAAAVSGISVFWTTMGIFIMAGIFYGCGAFLEAFKANASAGTGQGYELDAIAACVVGGISFNGGIGKISGAVIGVIIFTSLTYCLTFLRIDTNLQFVFKGLILIAAVALDSIKYLKRK